MNAPRLTRFSFATLAILIFALAAASATRAQTTSASTQPPGPIAAANASEKSLDQRQSRAQPAGGFVNRTIGFASRLRCAGKTKAQERREVVSRSDRKTPGADTSFR